MEKLHNLFEKLGYKDITKDNPIHFRDCLGEFFDSTYPYNKRFYKNDGIIDTELKVGNVYDMCFISGICYFSKGWHKFEVCGPFENIEERFQQTLDAVKQTIFNNYKED
jgi:hypothetical protein